jgi:hypothetical protein
LFGQVLLVQRNVAVVSASVHRWKPRGKWFS